MKDWKAWAVGGVLSALGLGLFVSKRGNLRISKLKPLQVSPVRIVRAASYTVPSVPRTINWIVIHTMESPEDANRAYNLGRNVFASPDRRASTHYGVDAGEVVRYVDEPLIAWGAEGANQQGIHIEHAGTANQNASQWNDSYSLDMLERSAELSANIAKRYGIPIKHLTWQEMKNGERGFVGHVDVNRMRRNGALDGNDHWDPGPNFPWDYYLGRVQAYMSNDPNPNIA